VRSIPLQFLLYLACSAAAAVTNLVVGFILINGFGFTSSLRYPVAVGIGYCAGMAVNFLLNRRFTFHGSDRTKIQQGRTFLVVALSGLALTAGIAALVRAMLPALLSSGTLGGINSPVTAETIGQVVAIGVVSLYSFAGHRFLTFNRGIRFQLLKIVRPVKNADG
jgi:putative flippase GtrA